MKESMKEVLEKLGAKPQGRGWFLERMGSFVYVGADMTKTEQYVLIGEITEALRGKGCYGFSVEYDENGHWVQLSLRMPPFHKQKWFVADTHLDCYIQAAKELL